MARPVDEANQTLSFSELKGIEPPFPLVGNFTLSGGAPFDFKLLENRGAVVSPLLLEDLNLKIGDKIRIPNSSGVGFALAAKIFWIAVEPIGEIARRIENEVFTVKQVEHDGRAVHGKKSRRFIARTPHVG